MASSARSKPAAGLIVEYRSTAQMTPRDRERIFGAAARLLEEHLAARGCGGHFILQTVDACKGSAARQGIHFPLADASSRRIKVSVQPGSNDTAWIYWLMPPHGVDVEKLWELLKTEPRPSHNRQPVKARPVAALPSEKKVEAKESPKAALSVQSFVEDLSLVAMTLESLFPQPTSAVDAVHVVDMFRESHSWDYEAARQAYQALVNRGHFAVSGAAANDASRRVCLVSLRSDALCDSFVSLGIHARREARSDAETETPQLPAREIEHRHLRSLRRGMTVEKEGKVAPIRPRQRVPEEPAVDPVSPSIVRSEGKLASQLAALEEQASKLESAQKQMASIRNARAALTERRNRLREELATVEAQIDESEIQFSEQFAILNDPELLAAADKVTRLREILG